MLPRQKRSTVPCATFGSLVNLASDCRLPFYFFAFLFCPSSRRSSGLSLKEARDDRHRKFQDPASIRHEMLANMQ